MTHIFRLPIRQAEARGSPVLISSHKISKKPYVQSAQKKLGVNQIKEYIDIKIDSVEKRLSTYNWVIYVLMPLIVAAIGIPTAIIARHGDLTLRLGGL